MSFFFLLKFVLKVFDIFCESESFSRDLQSYILGLYREGDHVSTVNMCHPMTRQGNKHRTALNEQELFV
jgi:hypothetical protein